MPETSKNQCRGQGINQFSNVKIRVIYEFVLYCNIIIHTYIIIRFEFKTSFNIHAFF